MGAAWDLPRGLCWDTEGGLGSRGALPGTPGPGPCPGATICHGHGGQAEINQLPFKLFHFFKENKVRGRFSVWVSLIWLVKKEKQVVMDPETEDLEQAEPPE